MHCRRARMDLLERELRILPPERGAELHRHLSSCPDCGAEARRGEWVREELALLRGETPFEVDVTTRVMTQVRLIGRPRPDEMSLRHWVFSAVAAVVCGVAILASLWDLIPALGEPARDAIGILDGIRGVMASLAASVGNLLAIPFKLLGTLLSSLSGMAPLLERLAPLGIALAATATASMTVTVVYFVGRDLRGRPLQPLQEKTR